MSGNRRSHHAPRRQPSAASRRPRSAGRPRKTSLKTRWWRALAALSPLSAVVVFAVLIAAALSVSIVVRFLADDLESSPDINLPAAANRFGADVAADSRPVDSSSAADPPVVSTTPPPAAARPSGRQLRRILVVGHAADMYPTVEAALQARRPGDIVELRSDRPIYCRPGATWTVDDDILIRAGNGFHPIVIREPTLPGMLVSFSGSKKNPAATVTLSGICFVNVTPPNPAGGPKHAAVYASCGIHLHRCLFVTTNAGLKWEANRLNDKGTVTDCYLYGLQTDTTDLINAGNGHLAIHNNLIVSGRRALTVGGGLDPNTEQICQVRISNNTIVHCEKLLTVYGPSEVTAARNLYAWQRQSHAFVIGTPVRSLEVVHRILNYDGVHNLFFQTRWGIYPTELQQGSGIARWQMLTRNSERQPRLADPGFVNPAAVASARLSLQPARDFSARISQTASPSIGAATGRLPDLPAGLGSLVHECLRKSGWL